MSVEKIETPAVCPYSDCGEEFDLEFTVEDPFTDCPECDGRIEITFDPDTKEVTLKAMDPDDEDEEDEEDESDADDGVTEIEEEEDEEDEE